MVINPGTNVNLLTNVPLDNTYEHTIFFASKDAQAAYFAGLSKYSYTRFTYQRVDRGRIRVGEKADNLYDCNYMMFQNAAYGDKWFYAFITSVEYINDVCSEIQYEIDVLQTWHFEYSPDYCFVDRCHTPTDQIGEHIEPEPVDTGEMVYNDYQAVADIQTLGVIMAIVDTAQGTEPNLYDGVFGAAELWAFNASDVSGIEDKINEYQTSPESIISMYMVPVGMLQDTISSGGTQLKQRSIAKTIAISPDGVRATDTLDGYTPHNCKMYTYPYNFLCVDNASGSSLPLRYEFFYQHTPMLQISGTITQPVCVVCYPRNYKGVTGVDATGQLKTANTETIQLNNYPMCSWNMDAYTAWIAQNSLPIAFNAAGSALTTGLSAVTNPSSIPFIGAGAIANVISLMSQGYQASISADITRGNLNNGGVNCATRKQTFWYGRLSVNQYMAKIIDSFFDTYGYAVKSMQKVMRNARPQWTYVKTVGANMVGNVPADDMRRICEIYDQGCTWWLHGENVGNYGLDNRATIRG